MDDRFDVVVIGTGPAGEVAVSRLAAQGLRTALVERELIGGECAYWACIPSKTLLRPPERRFQARRAAGTEDPLVHWPDVADCRDFMIRNLDDSSQVDGYESQGVTVVKRQGRIAGPRRVDADGPTASRASASSRTRRASRSTSDAARVTACGPSETSPGSCRSPMSGSIEDRRI